MARTVLDGQVRKSVKRSPTMESEDDQKCPSGRSLPRECVCGMASLVDHCVEGRSRRDAERQH
jgi:hypothetical protein